MDEPCSALDPISTGVIEELVHELRRELAVVIVTHNLAQAQRVADKVAFMYLGDLVEYGTAEEVFERTARGPHARLRPRSLRMSTTRSLAGEQAEQARREAAVNVAEAPAPPASAGQSSCSNCGAPLATDQRYCLSCGQPVSSTRLSFLDTLQSEQAQRAPTGSGAAADHSSPAEERGPAGPLGRYAGLFGLLAALLLAVVVGLLVGHWVTQTSTPGKQVFTVEGLTPASSAPAASAPSTAAPPAGSSTGGAATQGGGSGGNSSQPAAKAKNAPTHGGKAPAQPAPPSHAPKKAGEAKKAAEDKKASEATKAREDKKASEEKPVKLSKKTQENLAHSTGKKYEEEINKAVNSTQPIETG